jgi:hypothetical protein
MRLAGHPARVRGLYFMDENRDSVVNAFRKFVFIAFVGSVSGALMAGAAQARMYQWQHASTGASQLSGEPPSWYRSGRGGPRVRVFDGGNLVDDTAISLPNAQREDLREEAFRESEQRQRAEALKRLERLARQQQRRQTEQDRLAKERAQTEQQLAQQLRAEAANATAQAPVSSISPNEPLDDATVVRLKAIIGEFDRRGGSAK